MKIPFDIKYRPQIESGEYKVETRDGKPVRIICWDKKSEKKYGYHIVGLVEFGPQHEESTYYTIDGKGRLKDKEPELFIVTPESELSEFEKGLDSFLFEFANSSMEGCEPIKYVKKHSAGLLALAMEELKKKFVLLHKDDYQTAFDLGKAEALKDLPRWKKLGENGRNYSANTKFVINGRYLEMNDTLNNVYEVALSDLEKLPRFKED